MRIFYLLIVLLLPTYSFAQASNPEAIVQVQLEAYNEGDLDKFVACYHPDIKVYRYQNTEPFITGLDQMRNVYKDVFDNSPDLHAKIASRMIFDNKVIDYEQVTGRKDVDLLEAIAIYEVKEGLIFEVRFILK